MLAHGEGPNTWSDYFNQQLRWSRGTFEVLQRDGWRRMFRLHPKQLAHYALIVSFYPSMAVAWVLGAVNALLYLVIGASGIHVPVNLWLALYADATALQLLLYVSGRRHNVSPYERAGSTGVAGMLMSVLASPLYASAMVATAFRRPTRFVVTPKGRSSTVDNFATFRRHLQWCLLFASALVASVVLNHVSPMVCFWPAIALLVCLVPVGLWRAAAAPRAPRDHGARRDHSRHHRRPRSHACGRGTAGVPSLHCSTRTGGFVIRVPVKRRRLVYGAVGATAVLAANAPVVTAFASRQVHKFLITRPGYERHHGRWQTLVFPAGKRVNSVHAALLNTGEVMLMAGSGNDQQASNSHTYRTLLWNPTTNGLKLVPTPADVFCGGHAFLSNGNLLIAGGTQRYEVLAGNVTSAGERWRCPTRRPGN